QADGFPFTDHREKARALGFDVEALEGQGMSPRGPVFRLAVGVPIAGGAVLVTVLAPTTREREAREVFRDVLGSFRARTSWRTPLQRALPYVLVMAAALLLGY